MRNTMQNRLTFHHRIWFALLFPLGYFITYISKQNPQFTEDILTGILYKGISTVITLFTGLIPFSILEISMVILVPLFIIWCISMVFANDTSKLEGLNKCISTLLAGGGILYIIFVLCCGVNYNRLTLSHHMKLEVNLYSQVELQELCIELIENTNELRSMVITDQNNIATLPYNSNMEIAVASYDVFNNISNQYPFLKGARITPKAITLSPLMSYTEITGVFSPFTIEANYNSHAPDFFLPSTICHEIAHTRGFMREDEANFIGYLATSNSNVPEIAYSGYLLATTHAMNALYSTNYELFQKCYNLYSDDVLNDLNYNSEYWSKYEGKISDIADQVNDSYLKANNQTDGIKSYGRMVDLLLAEKNKRFKK